MAKKKKQKDRSWRSSNVLRKRRANAPPPKPPTRPRVIDANQKASEAFLKGRFVKAARLYEHAISLLTPDEDDLAFGIYENLGLVYFNQGRYRDALPAFLRALDGQPQNREQSLRFLIPALAHTRLFSQALSHLDAYTQHFGPHPDGWTHEYLHTLRDEHRAKVARSIPS